MILPTIPPDGVEVIKKERGCILNVREHLSESEGIVGPE